MKITLAHAAIVLGAVLTGQASHAADLITPLVPEPKQAEVIGGWTFTFAPYFWGAGISGNTKQFGLPDVHIDSSFGDILQNLDFAMMATGEARNGRFSVFGDIIYTKLSADGDTPRGIVTRNVEITSKTFSGLLGAGYAVIDDPSGHLDLVVGAKLWSVDTEVSFAGGFLDGVSRDDSATWVDAVAGVRGNYFFTPHVYMTGWGLVGAGGADIDWDVAGGLGYKFNERVSAVAGYRALGVNYNNDGFKFDVVQQGPIIGVAIHF